MSLFGCSMKARHSAKERSTCPHEITGSGGSGTGGGGSSSAVGATLWLRFTVAAAVAVDGARNLTQGTNHDLL